MSLPVIHGYTKHNLQAEVDIVNSEEEWGGIGHIHAHTKHNSQAEVDSGLGEKGERHWSFPIIHACTKHN